MKHSTPLLTSAKCLRRYPGNPVLAPSDIPYKSSLVFNAGIAKFNGKYVMVFRNDVAETDGVNKFIDTNLGLAFSDDGINWEVQPKPCFSMDCWDTAISMPDKPARAEVRRLYDPRLTVIDGRCVICCALDTEHGIHGAVAVTEDFQHYEILSMTVPDNRNMVLFPEKIGGEYFRLERPFPVYSRGGRDRFDIWCGRSRDLVYWGRHALVLAVEQVPYANDKIGPAAPPIKTPKGWLTTIHTVDVDPARGKNGWEDAWRKRYCAGIMLLDLEDPSKVIGLSREPLIAPEADYEVEGGFRNDVIFPGGMILEDSGEVKIYYGAADTVECLATADVNDLLALCTEPG
jgi:beta-1,4-mannooligosaccharide/beta-1,4-mannosyl-N-acetylglucosamine phosphorylase